MTQFVVINAIFLLTGWSESWPRLTRNVNQQHQQQQQQKQQRRGVRTDGGEDRGDGGGRGVEGVEDVGGRKRRGEEGVRGGGERFTGGAGHWNLDREMSNLTIAEFFQVTKDATLEICISL